MAKVNLKQSIFELYEKYRKWFKNEDDEQAKLAQYLELAGYKFTAIPNGLYVTSIKQKIMIKCMGLNAGLCDLLVILKNNNVLFIEMKKCRTRKKNGEYKALSSDGISISDEQKSWIEALNKCGNVEAIVCYGFLEAKEKIAYNESL